MKYPLFKVHIDKELALEELGKVFDSGFLNEGETVLEFTRGLEILLETDRVVPLNSCTSAITLALHVSKIGAGDEVITPSQTCIATNTPILDVGAVPIFADIEIDTATLNPHKLERLITDKTKAIICVDWAGMPPYLDRLQQICDGYGLTLIQDAAQALGSTFKGKPVCHSADFTCYSFQAIKHLTTGDGGALVCRNKEDYEAAKRLKWFGIDKENNIRKERWEGERWKEDVFEAGFKYNMTNIDAAIGLSQLPHFKKILATHQKNAVLYAKLFENNPKIIPLRYPDNSLPSFWTYVVILSDSLDRDKILQELNEAGIQAGLMHAPNHYYSCFNGKHVECQDTNYFYEHQISLPCGWWLQKEDIRYIATQLNIGVEKYGKE